MGGRLSALDADDEEDDLEVMERRAESPAGATETWAAGTTQLEEGVTETSSPEPASGAGAGAEETMQAPKDDLEAFFSQMDVPADPSGAASSSSQAPAEVESSETVQSPDDIDQQIAMADSAMIGEVEESSVIDLSSFDDATSEAASTRSEDDDLVTLDVNGETVGFDEDVAPVMPLDVTDPQQAETRQEDSPDDMVSLDAGAAFTTAKTKTSWEVEDDEGDVDTATSTPLTEDLPTTSGDLQAFHADETVDLFQKTETDEVGMPVDEETVTSMSIDDIGQQDTAVDEKPVTIEQVDKKPAEAPESSGEGNAPGEDLFDREYRVGMEDFGREDWASAVHHLSIAAALRPSDAQVKEKLREARARRKASRRRLTHNRGPSSPDRSVVRGGQPSTFHQITAIDSGCWIKRGGFVRAHSHALGDQSQRGRTIFRPGRRVRTHAGTLRKAHVPCRRWCRRSSNRVPPQRRGRGCCAQRGCRARRAHPVKVPSR